MWTSTSEINRYRAPDAAQRAALAAWCAADPGPIFVRSRDGSRRCGAAQQRCTASGTRQNIRADRHFVKPDLKEALKREAEMLGFDCIGVTDPGAIGDA